MGYSFSVDLGWLSVWRARGNGVREDLKDLKRELKKKGGKFWSSDTYLLRTVEDIVVAVAHVVNGNEYSLSFPDPERLVDRVFDFPAPGTADELETACRRISAALSYYGEYAGVEKGVQDYIEQVASRLAEELDSRYLRSSRDPDRVLKEVTYRSPLVEQFARRLLERRPSGAFFENGDGYSYAPGLGWLVRKYGRGNYRKGLYRYLFFNRSTLDFFRDVLKRNGKKELQLLFYDEENGYTALSLDRDGRVK